MVIDIKNNHLKNEERDYMNNKLFLVLLLVLNSLLVSADDLRIKVNDGTHKSNIFSYGGEQDVEGTATTANRNQTLSISGNTWKAVSLSNVEIKPNTVIEFDISCSAQVDIAGIGFDNDTELSPESTFKLYGTQDWGIQNYDNYADSAQSVKNYKIPVGKHFTGSYKYLVFVLDHDVESPNAEMIIENIHIRETEPAPLEIEFGSVKASSNWTTVRLKKSFYDPIIIMGPPSFNNDQPAAVRIKNVSRNSFIFKCQEWDYLDGIHEEEEIHYMIIERGNYSLPGGGRLEAGYVSLKNNISRNVKLNGFSSAPIILTSIASDYDPSSIATRVSAVSSTSFNIKLQEEEGNDQIHETEMVHYMSISTGSHELAGHKIQTGTQMGVRHNWVNINSEGFEKFIGGFQTTNGNDTATMRMRGKVGTDLQIFVEERNFERL